MIAVTQQKRCSICGEVKAFSEFNQAGQSYQGRCRPCNRAYMRDYYERNKARMIEQDRVGTLRRSYGITPADYERMLAGQAGGCAICGHAPKGGRRLAVDHDHATDAVRGLLCQPCNTALGLFKDDLALLERAVEYLDHDLN